MKGDPPADDGAGLSAAGALFFFFRILRTGLPGAGNFQQRLPVLSAHLVRDTDTIRRVFPEFFRLPQPGLLNPCRGNADFWNFVLQQFCDAKLRGTNGPELDFYHCVSGRVGCRFFPLSIIVDMPRNA